jgi:glutamate-1-semialdehyde 2,1-aminomutase
MELVAPSGPVYQAGTLSGNPLAMAAGIATLDELAKPGTWDAAERAAGAAAAALEEAARRAQAPLTVQRSGTMFTPFFTNRRVTDFTSAQSSSRERYAVFFHHMLERGVYLPPSGYEMWTLSTAHGPEEIGSTIEVAASFAG